MGDGHPVLVIPGFLTNDLYMAELRDRIAAKGYKVYGWENGINWGATQSAATHVEDILKKISAENDNRKISLIGYSLGGVYARELARKHPELVRDVITLSAPFGLVDSRGQPDSAICRIHAYYQGDTKECAPAQAPSVPTTSIFSRQDWIVDWHSSINAPANGAENIEVTGGHIAMPFNRQATAVVLERLARKDTQPHTPAPAVNQRSQNARSPKQ